MASQADGIAPNQLWPLRTTIQESLSILNAFIGRLVHEADTLDELVFVVTATAHFEHQDLLRRIGITTITRDVGIAHRVAQRLRAVEW
jgi:hypothetical protein